MKKILVVAAAVAVLAVPMMGSAAKVKKCAPVCPPVACAPVCAPVCPPAPSYCFDPLAPVVGVVNGVGCLVGSTFNGIAGIFTCNPCQ